MRTLRNAIVTTYADAKTQTDWDIQLPAIAFALNTHVHDDIGETPFFLVFGRDPRLPLDFALMAELDHEDSSVFSSVSEIAKYRPEHRQQLARAYELVRNLTTYQTLR